MNDDLYKIVKGLEEEADKKYAIKLVERIVFAILGVVGLAVLYKLLLLINLKP